jgi:hypothetical protein
MYNISGWVYNWNTAHVPDLTTPCIVSKQFDAVNTLLTLEVEHSCSIGDDFAKHTQGETISTHKAQRVAQKG